MENHQEELLHYLKDTLTKLKNLSSEVKLRNKTKKFKAIASLLLLAEGKAEATFRFAKAGGYKDLSVVLEKHLYDPIVDWLSGEIHN
mgnify:CR=1 FL=1